MSSVARPRSRHGVAWRLAQVTIAAVVVWYVGRTLVRQWDAVQRSVVELHPHWGWLAASAALVLATYAILIQAWRALVNDCGSRLTYATAARIFFLSSFGKYVPGKLWSISAMGIMSAREGVSPFAATGSSIVATLLSIGTGFAVLLGLGSESLRQEYPWARPLAVLLAVALTVGIAALGPLLGPLIRAFERRTGRALLAGDARLPRTRTLLLSAAANGLAWVLYGVAFLMLARAVLGEATGATAGYVTVYTASYLLGYLAVFAPGGLGVRESVMITLMPRLGLATAADAVVLAAISRLWITVLELVPGLLFLARGGMRARTTQTVDDGSL